MPLLHNTARNVFAFMSLHIAVYFIDQAMAVNTASLPFNTCMVTNLSAVNDTAQIMNEHFQFLEPAFF